MENETTTDAFGEGLGAENTVTPNQPEEPAVESQEQPVEASEEQSTEGGDKPEPELDEDMEYLKGKGINPEDPDALKKTIAMYRGAEKKMHQQGEEVSTLRRQFEQSQEGPKTEMQVLNERIQRMENEKMVRDFRDKFHPSEQEEQQMVEYLKGTTMLTNGTAIQNGQLVKQGALSLESVYRIIGGGAIDPKAIQEQTRAEVLEEIANKQRAQRPTGSSTNSKQFSSPEGEDPFLTGLLES